MPEFFSTKRTVSRRPSLSPLEGWPMFEVLARCGAARRGRLTTASGLVETPVFMPCGTYGTVKAMTPEGLVAVGAQISWATPST